MIQTAEQLFNDGANYGKFLSKFKAKVKGTAGGRIMKPEEVLKRLQELNINVGDRTLRDWKNKELIPLPKTGS